eukprot:307049-Pleurochrysis_carterae.AAC.2
MPWLVLLSVSLSVQSSDFGHDSAQQRGAFDMQPKFHLPPSACLWQYELSELTIFSQAEPRAATIYHLPTQGAGLAVSCGGPIADTHTPRTAYCRVSQRA